MKELMKELLEKINIKFDYLIELYSDPGLEEIKKGIEIAKEDINREMVIYSSEMSIKIGEILIKEAENILEERIKKHSKQFERNSR